MLKDAFVSGLPDLVGLAVHPQWSCSFHLRTRFGSQPHAFGRCL